MGFEEVMTETGRGFIYCGYRSYQPECDLTALALRVGKLIDTDQYRTDSVRVATEIPPAWFVNNSGALDSILLRMTAGARVGASLQPGRHPHSEAQRFTIFLAECETAGDSAVLNSLVRPSGSECATLGIAEDRLFALLVARSFVGGVDSYESSETVERFRAPLTSLLRGVQRQ